MICRFCSQWNPDLAVRCGFCGNARDAARDAEGEQGPKPVSLPEIPPGMERALLDDDPLERGPGLRLAIHFPPWVLPVGVVLGAVGLILYRSCGR